MSCYFVAQIKIDDPEEYQKYLEQTDKVFSQYNGKYLAVDPQPQVLEGNWAYSRIVLIEFKSETELRRWYESPEYQSILQYRLKAGNCDTVLVKGIE